MRRCICLFVLLLCTARPALAADAPKPEELQKMYADALAQLKAAQDRKNALAAENDKLAGKVADLQKQLKATQDQLDVLNRDSASWDDRWFDLRAQDSIWRSFLAGDADLQRRWNAYYANVEQADPALAPGLENPLLTPVEPPSVLPVIMAPVSAAPTTGPTSLPATAKVH